MNAGTDEAGTSIGAPTASRSAARSPDVRKTRLGTRALPAPTVGGRPVRHDPARVRHWPPGSVSAKLGGHAADSAAHGLLPLQSFRHADFLHNRGCRAFTFHVDPQAHARRGQRRVRRSGSSSRATCCTAAREWRTASISCRRSGALRELSRRPGGHDMMKGAGALPARGRGDDGAVAEAAGVHRDGLAAGADRGGSCWASRTRSSSPSCSC